jgi:hypothetical protein
MKTRQHIPAFGKWICGMNPRWSRHLFIFSTVLACASMVFTGCKPSEPEEVSTYPADFKTEPSPVFSLSDEVVNEFLNGDARIQEGVLFLDGDADYIERPSAEEFALSKGLTVAATVKLDPPAEPSSIKLSCRLTP